MDTIKIQKNQVKMVAHRGVSGLELENTCAAFVAAGNRSYFGVETDVHVTKDGKFVITADRFTNQMLQLGSNPQALAEAVRMVTGQAYEIIFRDRTKAMEEDPLNEL